MPSLSERGCLQEEEYAFPYHYLPHLSAGGASNLRFLRWGLEYVCYLGHIAAIVEELGPRSHLDVGCGEARLFSVTGRDRRRVGVDFSSRALQFARAFNPDAAFFTDLSSLGTESFDLVSAVEVLEHVPDEEIGPFLGVLRDRTRSGGHLLLSVPSTVQPLHAKHYRHYDEPLLTEQVHAACADLELVRCDHVYRTSRWVDLYMRWTLNRLVVVEVAPLRRVVWRHVWHHLRCAGPGRGRHLVGLFRRR